MNARCPVCGDAFAGGGRRVTNFTGPLIHYDGGCFGEWLRMPEELREHLASSLEITGR